MDKKAKPRTPAIFQLLALAVGFTAPCAVLAWFAADQIFGSRAGWVDLGYVFAPWMAFVLALLMLAAIVFRSMPLGLSSLAALACLGWIYAPQFLPSRVSAAESATPLRVMSYNVWGETFARHMPESAAVVAKAAPDVLVIIEIGRKGADRFAPILRGATDSAQVNALTYSAADDRTATVVMSRYPVRLIKDDANLSRLARYEVSLPSGPAEVWAVHAYRTNFLPFPNPLSYRDLSVHVDPDEQFGWLAEQIARQKADQPGKPLIMAGDFNMPALSPHYRMISGQLDEIQSEAGQGLGMTFPASLAHKRVVRILGRNRWIGLPFELARIDHMFYSPVALRARQAWVADGGGSDHAPIVADFELR